MSDVVMVTGAGGLIGSHLVEELLQRGNKVYGLDIVDSTRCDNLSGVRNHPNFHYTQGDIRSQEAMVSFFRPDAKTLYHLASVVGVNRYMEDPLSLIDIAIFGTRNLVSLCEQHGVRMLFTSTSEVYGRNPDVPWAEDCDRVLGATNIDRWAYSSSKAVCEHMLFGVHHKSGWPMSIVRFFNVYGPRQSPIYVVSKTVHQVLNGTAPELYDGGHMTRCLTYVGDVVEGIIEAGTKREAIGEIINLGNPVENTVEEIISMVLEEAGSDLKPIPVATNKKYGKVYEDIARRVPKVEKAEVLLGWKAKTSAREGIAKTIAWAKGNPWYLK